MNSNTPENDRPYWLILLIGIGLWLFYEVWANQIYADVLATLSKGIWLTVLVTLVILTHRKIGWFTGLIFLGLYAAYIYGLIQGWTFEDARCLVLECPAVQ